MLYNVHHIRAGAHVRFPNFAYETVTDVFNGRPQLLFSQDKTQVFNLTNNKFQSKILKAITLLTVL